MGLLSWLTGSDKPDKGGKSTTPPMKPITPKYPPRKTVPPKPKGK